MFNKTVTTRKERLLFKSSRPQYTSSFLPFLSCLIDTKSMLNLTPGILLVFHCYNVLDTICFRSFQWPLKAAVPILLLSALAWWLWLSLTQVRLKLVLSTSHLHNVTPRSSPPCRPKSGKFARHFPPSGSSLTPWKTISTKKVKIEPLRDFNHVLIFIFNSIYSLIFPVTYNT